MKTIYYQQNQIIISKNNQPGNINTFYHPDSKIIRDVVHLFLNSTNYEALFVGQQTEILKQIIEQFTSIKAAGGVVANTKNEIVLIYRLGKWDLPKGKLEPRESAANGALREVEEECGISGLQIIKPLKPTYHVYKTNNGWVLKTCNWYLMQYQGHQTLCPQTEEGITEAKWISAATLKINELDTYPTITNVLIQSLPLLV